MFGGLRKSLCWPIDAVDDEFVKYMFQLVEEDPEDVENDPYHYPIIRILVGSLSARQSERS